MFFDQPVVDALAKGVMLSGLALAWVIMLVRVVGLRSFSKMTNFDFVITIAMGSLLAGASQSENWIGFLQTLTAMGCLFAVQYFVSALRRKSEAFDQLVQNTPVLLMKDGHILHEALAKTRVSEEDLISKLREANVHHFASVRAVVLETTGNLSVLHGQTLEDRLLRGVTRV
jgi:uncharacterized membrane protein YcaP (DUF421 family)